MSFFKISQMQLANLDHIKIQNRNHAITKLETGDLVKVKADILPIIYHYGIVEKQGDKLFIYHNQPDKINSKGGNLICEPFENFIAGKDILEVKKTQLDSTDLHKMYQALSGLKYHFVGFNCEHYINFVTDRKPISNQVYRWTAIGIIGFVVYYLIKNKKI